MVKKWNSRNSPVKLGANQIGSEIHARRRTSNALIYLRAIGCKDSKVVIPMLGMHQRLQP